MALGFTLTPDGADKITGGLKGLFGSLGNASMARQLGEQKTGLTNAQIYHANMTGNKAGAEADSERFTLQNRQGADAEIANNPDLTPVQKLTLWAFKNAGAGKVKDFAGAGTEYQTQGIRDKAVANVDNPDIMNRYSTIAKPGATYMPFDNIGNTGTVFNKATGDGSVASTVLDKIYGKVQDSIAGQHNASADLSKERTKEIQLGKLTPGTDENGDPILFRSGTAGDVSVIDDVSPYKKAGGTEATQAKARARVVEKVFADPMVMPEDRQAEVEKRIAMSQAPAKSPAASPVDTKIDLPDSAKSVLKEGVVTTFKNGQKWTIRGGKPAKVN